MDTRRATSQRSLDGAAGRQRGKEVPFPVLHTEEEEKRCAISAERQGASAERLRVGRDTPGTDGAKMGAPDDIPSTRVFAQREPTQGSHDGVRTRTHAASTAPKQDAARVCRHARTRAPSKAMYAAFGERLQNDGRR